MHEGLGDGECKVWFHYGASVCYSPTASCMTGYPFSQFWVDGGFGQSFPVKGQRFTRTASRLSLRHFYSLSIWRDICFAIKIISVFARTLYHGHWQGIDINFRSHRKVFPVISMAVKEAAVYIKLSWCWLRDVTQSTSNCGKRCWWKFLKPSFHLLQTKVWFKHICSFAFYRFRFTWAG